MDSSWSSVGCGQSVLRSLGCDIPMPKHYHSDQNVSPTSARGFLFYTNRQSVPSQEFIFSLLYKLLKFLFSFHLERVNLVI